MDISYKIKRTDIFLGKKLRFGESKYTRFVRLAKKNKGIWIRPVHEYWDVSEPIRTLSSPLTHYSATSVFSFIKKINYYSTINSKYLYENGIKSSFFSILFYPLGKFIKNYIWYQGFRDGTEGFIHAVSMSFHSFLTRAKLYLLWNNNPSSD